MITYVSQDLEISIPNLHRNIETLLRRFNRSDLVDGVEPKHRLEYLAKVVYRFILNLKDEQIFTNYEDKTLEVDTKHFLESELYNEICKTKPKS